MPKHHQDEFLKTHFTRECFVLLEDLNRSGKNNRTQTRKTQSAISVCVACQVEFNSAEDLERHKHKPFFCKYSCKICTKKINTKNGLMAHILQHRVSQTSKSSAATTTTELSITHVCVICCDGFTSLAQLQSHKNLHESATIKHEPYDKDDFNNSSVNDKVVEELHTSDLSTIKHELDDIDQFNSSVSEQVEANKEVAIETSLNESSVTSISENVPPLNSNISSILLTDPSTSDISLPVVPWLAPILPQCPPYLIYGNVVFVRLDTLNMNQVDNQQQQNQQQQQPQQQLDGKPVATQNALGVGLGSMAGKQQSERALEPLVGEQQNKRGLASLVGEQKKKRGLGSLVDEQPSERASGSLVGEQKKIRASLVGEKQSKRELGFLVGKEQNKRALGSLVGKKQNTRELESLVGEKQNKLALGSLVSKQQNERGLGSLLGEKQNKLALGLLVGKQRSERGLGSLVGEKQNKLALGSLVSKQQNERGLGSLLGEEQNKHAPGLLVGKQRSERGLGNLDGKQKNKRGEPQSERRLRPSVRKQINKRGSESLVGEQQSERRFGSLVGEQKKKLGLGSLVAEQQSELTLGSLLGKQKKDLELEPLDGKQQQPELTLGNLLQKQRKKSGLEPLVGEQHAELSIVKPTSVKRKASRDQRQNSANKRSRSSGQLETPREAAEKSVDSNKPLHTPIKYKLVPDDSKDSQNSATFKLVRDYSEDVKAVPKERKIPIPRQNTNYKPFSESEVQKFIDKKDDSTESSPTKLQQRRRRKRTPSISATRIYNFAGTPSTYSQPEFTADAAAFKVVRDHSGGAKLVPTVQKLIDKKDDSTANSTEPYAPKLQQRRRRKRNPSISATRICNFAGTPSTYSQAEFTADGSPIISKDAAAFKVVRDHSGGAKLVPKVQKLIDKKDSTITKPSTSKIARRGRPKGTPPSVEATSEITNIVETPNYSQAEFTAGMPVITRVESLASQEDLASLNDDKDNKETSAETSIRNFSSRVHNIKTRATYRCSICKVTYNNFPDIRAHCRKAHSLLSKT